MVFVILLQVRKVKFYFTCIITILSSNSNSLSNCNNMTTPVVFIIIVIINKVLIKVTLNKVIAGALYIVICG